MTSDTNYELANDIMFKKLEEMSIQANQTIQELKSINEKYGWNK